MKSFLTFIGLFFSLFSFAQQPFSQKEIDAAIKFQEMMIKNYEEALKNPKISEQEKAVLQLLIAQEKEGLTTYKERVAKEAAEKKHKDEIRLKNEKDVTPVITNLKITPNASTPTIYLSILRYKGKPISFVQISSLDVERKWINCTHRFSKSAVPSEDALELIATYGFSLYEQLLEKQFSFSNLYYEGRDESKILPASITHSLEMLKLE